MNDFHRFSKRFGKIQGKLQEQAEREYAYALSQIVSVTEQMASLKDELTMAMHHRADISLLQDWPLWEQRVRYLQQQLMRYQEWLSELEGQANLKRTQLHKAHQQSEKWKSIVGKLDEEWQAEVAASVQREADEVAMIRFGRSQTAGG